MDVLCNVSKPATYSAPRRFDQSIVSDVTLSIFTAVVDTWLSLLVSFAGVIANVVTVSVFARMGFKDTVSITMTTIALWDLTRVLCGTAHRLYGPISLVSPTMGVSWQNFTIPYVNSLQNLATNVAYVIGAYVALERCLCISFPLKVKVLLTKRATVCTCAVLSALVSGTLFPSLLLLEVTWTQVSGQSESVAIYQFSKFYKIYGSAYMGFYTCVNLLYPVVSLTAMVSSTAVIAYYLHRASRWRKQMTSSMTAFTPGLTTRDVKVVKMLMWVILSYALVLIPRVVTFIVQLFVPQFMLLNQYNNIFRLAVCLILFLDFINSSVGLVIFYVMSSKFKSCLLGIICLRKAKI